MSTLTPITSSTAAPATATGPQQVTSPSVLPQAQVVSGVVSGRQSNGNTASGDNSDQGRESFEQTVAGRIRRSASGLSNAAPSSIIDAQLANESSGMADRYKRMAPPDPLPTAPILQNLRDPED